MWKEGVAATNPYIAHLPIHAGKNEGCDHGFGFGQKTFIPKARLHVPCTLPLIHMTTGQPMPATPKQFADVALTAALR